MELWPQQVRRSMYSPMGRRDELYSKSPQGLGSLWHIVQKTEKDKARPSCRYRPQYNVFALDTQPVYWAFSYGWSTNEHRSVSGRQSRGGSRKRRASWYNQSPHRLLSFNIQDPCSGFERARVSGILEKAWQHANPDRANEGYGELRGGGGVRRLRCGAGVGSFWAKVVRQDRRQIVGN